MAKYHLSPSSTLRSGTFHSSKYINAKRLVRDYINVAEIGSFHAAARSRCLYKRTFALLTILTPRLGLVPSYSGCYSLATSLVWQCDTPVVAIGWIR